MLFFAPLLQAAGGFSISWQAPDTCGTQGDFEAGVSRIVGKPFAELGSSWQTADVVIVATADGWRLRVGVVSTSGAHRERDVLTTTCREAVQAAELIVATSLSGVVALAASPDEAAKSDDSAARARSAPVTPAAVAPSGAKPDSAKPPALATAPGAATAAPTAHETAARRTTSASALTFALAARVGLEPLLLKSATTLAWGVASLESERFKAELALGGSYPESDAVSGGGRAVTQLLTAGLAGCYGGSAHDFRLWGCVGGELGRFSATGENISNSTTTHELWSAALVQGELTHQLAGHFELVLGAQGVLAPHRIRVVESKPTVVVYTTHEQDIRPWLGVAGRF
ncbi:MAG TPA: hypothetical protein VK745_26715 [Polyangiaceae bacterium]|nr:hypothetical protein [Polyangiaceae bacterium]